MREPGGTEDGGTGAPSCPRRGATGLRAGGNLIPLCFALAVLAATPASSEISSTASSEESPLPLSEEQAFDGRAILEALAAAWPARISGPERLDGDWAVRLDDSWYLWAGGRLLPALAGLDEAAWSPWPFYAYPDTLPPVTRLDAGEKQRLDALLAERDRDPPRRYPAFYDQLWYSRSEKEAWDRAKTIRFFGTEILVNPDLLEEVAGIERGLRDKALTNPAVAAWIASIDAVEGYAWRSVQGTNSRSMHSYGAAIDVVPRNTRNLAWYWLDAKESGLAWYELPYSRRITVPEAVVAVFEDHGFIWGGKWFYWDLVHFEYRPEILVLNGKRPIYQESVR